MIYVGECLNPKCQEHLRKAVIALGALFTIAMAILGLGGLAESLKIAGMKDEIAEKSKIIADAQAAAHLANAKPAVKIPIGLAAAGAFQDRFNKLASGNGCAITQYQASDQMNPYVSTFSNAGAGQGPWGQIDVKVNLAGPTQAVVQTLRNLGGLGIPYEFTSLEMSRAQVSPSGAATINAALSLRVLTLGGGA